MTVLGSCWGVGVLVKREDTRKIILDYFYIDYYKRGSLLDWEKKVCYTRLFLNVSRDEAFIMPNH